MSENKLDLMLKYEYLQLEEGFPYDFVTVIDNKGYQLFEFLKDN